MEVTRLVLPPPRLLKHSNKLLFVLCIVLLLAIHVCCDANCLIFSDDGTTVTGTDGTCVNVTAVDFENATQIGNGAFISSKDYILTVEFPSTLQTVGYDAFSGCSNLTGELRIPASLVVKGGAFSGCSFDTLTIEEGAVIDSSFSGAFSGLSNLATVNICKNVTVEIDNLFYQNNTISQVNIDSGVKITAQKTFYQCRNISSLSIANGVELSGSYTFWGNSNLKGIDFSGIGTGDIVIGDYSFQGSGLTGTLVLPNNVVSVGNYAFSLNSGLTGLSFGSGLQSIGSGAFQYLNIEGTYIIPESVNYIGDYAFTGTSKVNAWLVNNKNLQLGGIYCFAGSGPVFGYNDWSYYSYIYGTKFIPFITSISVDEVKVRKTENVQAVVNYLCSTYSCSQDLDYIPYITWETTGTDGITLATNKTGAGIIENTITGNDFGVYTVTVKAAQVGSDIFGEDQVPAIPSASLKVKVKSCLNLSEDGTKVIGTDGTCVNVTPEDFMGATIIADATDPEVEAYGRGVFQYRSSGSYGTLKSVIFPDNLTYIGDLAFYECHGLDNVLIPASVTWLGAGAFGNIQELGNVMILSKNMRFSTDDYKSPPFIYTSAPAGGSKIFGYEDSSWWNDITTAYGEENSDRIFNGNVEKIYLIEELFADDLEMNIGDNIDNLFTADQIDSIQYIPSTTWTPSNSAAITLADTVTGLGQTKNNVTGNEVGVYTVEINAVQVGSDIFGNGAPAIPSTTFSVTIKATTMSLTIVKQWDDFNNVDGFRPDSVCIRLLDNNEPTEYKVILSGTGNTWEHTFSDIPISEHYTILETGTTCE